MRTFFLFVALSVLSACGSSSYTFHQSGQDLYRLDSSSGEVDVIQGRKMVHVDEVSKDDLAALKKVKTWNDKTLPVHNLKMSLKTMWYKGKLHYILVASPYSKTLHEVRERKGKNANFTLLMRDENGFEMMQILVHLDRMIRLFDNNGQVVALLANSKVRCGADLYKDLKSWSLSWNL